MYELHGVRSSTMLIGCVHLRAWWELRLNSLRSRIFSSLVLKRGSIAKDNGSATFSNEPNMSPTSRRLRHQTFSKSSRKDTIIGRLTLSYLFSGPPHHTLLIIRFGNKSFRSSIVSPDHNKLTTHFRTWVFRHSVSRCTTTLYYIELPHKLSQLQAVLRCSLEAPLKDINYYLLNYLNPYIIKISALRSRG